MIVLPWKGSVPERAPKVRILQAPLMFYTDGTNLFELIAEDFRENHARSPFCERGSIICEVAIENCRTGERRLIWGEQLAQLREVCEW